MEALALGHRVSDGSKPRTSTFKKNQNQPTLKTIDSSETDGIIKKEDKGIIEEIK